MTSSATKMALDPKLKSGVEKSEVSSGSGKPQVPRAHEQEIDRQEQIRTLAYRLWEQHGRPEGTAEEDWYQAECAFDSEADTTE